MAKHSASVNGMEIHYLEEGRGGTPIVLLHGITDNHESYLPIVPQLAKRGRVLAPDFRGHGDSSRGSTPYRIEDYGTDVVQFLEQVVGEPAFVAGHSLGGLVASWLGTRIGARLRGLLLEDPPLYKAQLPSFTETGFYPVFAQIQAAVRAHRAAGGSVEALIPLVGAAPADMASGQGPTLLEARGEAGVRALASSLHRFDPDAFDALFQGTLFDGFDPDKELSSVPCPVRVIAGNYELGAAMDGADVERVSSLIPCCSAVTWNDVGHEIHRERPNPYTRELLSFVESAR